MGGPLAGGGGMHINPWGAMMMMDLMDDYQIS